MCANTMYEALPPEFRVKLRYRPTRKLRIGLELTAGAIFAPGFGAFYLHFAPQLPRWWIPAAFLSLLITLALHEGVHGLLLKLLGAKPVIGLRFLGAYTTTAEAYFTRLEFVLIALSPLLTLSTIGLLVIGAHPAWTPWLSVPMLVNASASVGDVWLAGVVLKQPRNGLVGIFKDQMVIYVEEGSA